LEKKREESGNSARATGVKIAPFNKRQHTNFHKTVTIDGPWQHGIWTAI